MENKNKHVRVGFSTILWTVMAILLCAAQGTWAEDKICDDGQTHNIDYEIQGSLIVRNAIVNLKPGASVRDAVDAFPDSVVNIYGGNVGWWIAVYEPTTQEESVPEVTVYGTDFTTNGGSLDYGEWTPSSGSAVLTGTYEDGSPINLWIMSNIPIYLAESITVNIEKAKVSWDHSDIRVYGKLYLPQGFWMDTLAPNGGVVTTLAGVEVANQSVAFAIKGKDGHKWEYKDKENIDGPIKEFKIDWKGAKFDYKGDDKFHIHTHFIGGTETTLCIHTGDVSGAFTVSVNGTTIAYDEEKSITTDLEYELQKDNNTHVHFTLPFQLTPDMTIKVSGAIINVADYYEEGFVKFKLVSAFDSVSFPQGSESSPEELEIEISLGEAPNTISGSDLIEAWTKQDHKHWEYK